MAPVRRSRGALLVTTAVLACATVLASPVGDPVDTLDPAVRIVASGGFWEEAGRYGTCRVVVSAVGWEHVRSRVEVQWLVTDDAAKTVRVHRSRLVRELSEDAWVHVRSVDYEESGEDSRFLVRYSTREDADVVRVVTLVVAAPGTYEVVASAGDRP